MQDNPVVAVSDPKSQAFIVSGQRLVEKRCRLLRHHAAVLRSVILYERSFTDTLGPLSAGYLDPSSRHGRDVRQ